MRQANITLVLAVLGVCSFIGCSKSPSEKPSASDDAKPVPVFAATNTHATISRPSSPVVTRVPKQPLPTPKPSILEKDYRATTNDNRKTEIIYKFGEIGTPDCVVAIGRLFRVEEDADLKEEMLNVLSIFDGAEKEKLSVYMIGIQAGQSDDVRMASIDGLGDLEDRRVIPVLQELMKDPNEEIRDAAKDALETVQATLDSN